MTQDSLAHYGVMGMKWGVRKDGRPQGYQGSGSSSSKSTAETANRISNRKAKKIEKQKIKAIKKDRKQAARKRSILSDEELDKRIDRLSKEKKLKELTDSQVRPGKKYANDVLSVSGKKIAIAASTAAGAAAVAYVVGKERIPVSNVAKDIYKMSTKTK